MAQMNMKEAIRDAMRVELSRDLTLSSSVKT